MKNTFKYLIAGVMLAFGTVASANSVPPPPAVIDFGTGLTFGGSLSAADVNGDVIATDISIGTLLITNSLDAGANSAWVVTNGKLNFDTAAETLSIVGGVTVNGVSILDGTTLFEGNLTDFNYTPTSSTDIFLGTGAGVASLELLGAMGESQGVFTYVAFSLKSNVATGFFSTDLQATQTSRGLVPEVPIPAAAWLFGSGLLGLVGVARRKPA